MVYEPYSFVPYFQCADDENKFNAPFVFYETWGDVDDGISRDCDIMQFTGLKDKNGKEIWEGDRLMAIIPSTGQTKEVVVRWENEQGGFLVEWEYSKNQNYVNLTCDVAHCSEVIGNIYQNQT